MIKFISRINACESLAPSQARPRPSPPLPQFVLCRTGSQTQLLHSEAYALRTNPGVTGSCKRCVAPQDSSAAAKSTVHGPCLVKRSPRGRGIFTGHRLVPYRGRKGALVIVRPRSTMTLASMTSFVPRLTHAVWRLWRQRAHTDPCASFAASCS